MFNKFYKGLLFGAIALFAFSCSEDHELYNTAAKPGIEQMDGEYEVGVPITFRDNTIPTEGTQIVSYLWEFGDEENSTSTEMTPTFTYKKDGT